MIKKFKTNRKNEQQQYFQRNLSSLRSFSKRQKTKKPKHFPTVNFLKLQIFKKE